MGKEKKKKKKNKSFYCMYAGTCDKDYDCRNGDFCSAFRHTKQFSSLRFN